MSTAPVIEGESCSHTVSNVGSSGKLLTTLGFEPSLGNGGD